MRKVFCSSADALVDVRQHKRRMIKDLDRQREERMIGYDPFGRPGAGAPNRDEQGDKCV